MSETPPADPEPKPDAAGSAKTPEPDAPADKQPVRLSAPSAGGPAASLAGGAAAPEGQRLTGGPTGAAATPPPRAGDALGSGQRHDGPQAQGRSPYDHLLKIRGDVDPTKAIALFLLGMTAFLLVWGFLTAGGPEPHEGKAKVGPDGKVTIPHALDAERAPWVDGHSPASAPGELADRQFRFVPPSTLELPKAAAGAEVTYGYDLGREPLVSAFLLPKPGAVFAAIIELTTGTAFQVRCSNKECAQRGKPQDLSSGQGEALERWRVESMQKKAGEPPPAAPDAKCATCGKPFAGEVAVPLPPYAFRAGLVSSLGRTTLGFLIAVAIVLPLAVLAGAYPPIARLLGPVEVAGGYAPPVALLPLAIALSGFLNTNHVVESAATSENVARIAFLVVVTAFWLYPLVVKEVAGVEQVYVNTAYTLGASRSQVVLKVLVPIASAGIWEHLRACYAIGWASILLAEGYASSQVAGDTGIGFFMANMQRRHFMENYFAAVFVIIATGLVIDFIFKLVGRRLFPWQGAR